MRFIARVNLPGPRTLPIWLLATAGFLAINSQMVEYFAPLRACDNLYKAFYALTGFGCT